MANSCEESCEPMDVDQSLHSEKSFNRSKEIKTPENMTLNSEEYSFKQQVLTSTPQTNIKVYHINYESKVKKNSYCKNILYHVFFLSIGFAISIMFSINCNDRLDSHTVLKNLNAKLYGQEDAIKRIAETIQNDHKNKILFFYGGTGVGKTYAASLILNGAWNCTNVYHYTMPSFKDTFSSSSIHGLNICNSAFMVVDDLTGDSDISPLIDEVVAKSEKLKTNLTMLLIYNCNTMDMGFKKNCDQSFKIKLEETFSNINALKGFVKFETLTTGHLKKCMEDAIGGKTISDKLFEDWSRNFDVSSDGCKGVGSKMKFLNVKV